MKREINRLCFLYLEEILKLWEIAPSVFLNNKNFPEFCPVTVLLPESFNTFGILPLRFLFFYDGKKRSLLSPSYRITILNFLINRQFFKNYISSFAKIDNVLISSSKCILIYGGNTSGNKEHFLAYINFFHIVETYSIFLYFYYTS